MTKSGKYSTKAKRSPPDAITLLKTDHRQVKQWFRAFERSKTSTRKKRLAGQICDALTVHMAIEERMFYPAFIAATRDKNIHHEAIIEHRGAKKLIRDIASSSPRDDYFDAKVKVLSEQIKHHVKEEEQPGGMFSEARQSGMDLLELGARMKARKDQLAKRS